MKDQWKYEFYLEGSLRDPNSDSWMIKPTKEHRYYNHLASAFGDLLQVNPFGFEHQFGGISRAGGARLMYNKAIIRETGTGRTLVEIANISGKATVPHRFLHAGLYLRFEDGISAFQKELGLSLSALGSTKKQTANLATYYNVNGLTLVANPGLIELSAILHQYRSHHQLEPYHLSLRGPATDPFNFYNSHFQYDSLREGFTALLQLDLQRLTMHRYAGPIAGHPIHTATLAHYATDLAILAKVDRRPENVVLPGAYLVFPSGSEDLVRQAGIDLSGFGRSWIGSKQYLKIGSLSQDGTTLEPFATLDALRESLTVGGQAPYFIQFTYTGGMEGKDVTDATPIPFQSIKTALQYLTGMAGEVLDETPANGRKVRLVEIIERDSDQVVAQLFKQQAHSDHIFPGYYLKVSPTHILPHLAELAPLLTPTTEDKQLHFLLAPIPPGPALRKSTGRPPRHWPATRPKGNSR